MESAQAVQVSYSLGSLTHGSRASCGAPGAPAALLPCSPAQRLSCCALLLLLVAAVLLLALLRRAGRAETVLALATDLCSCLGKEPDSSVELCGE